MKTELIKRILSTIFLLLFSFFIIYEGSLVFILFLISLFLISIFEWTRMSKRKIYLFPGILFITLSFYSVYLLRIDPTYQNYFFFLYCIIISVSTDIGGFLFGKLFKGPKLTQISPNKTYSGVFGSYFFTIIFIFIYINNFDYVGNFLTDYLLFVFALISSTVSQIGDIIISYFKRLNKLKNTGSLIPGHGGLLDRIDGMLFVFPFVFIGISLIK